MNGPVEINVVKPTRETVMNSSVTLPTSNNGTDFLPYNSFLFLNIILLIFGLPLNSYVVRLITAGAGSGVASEFFALNLSVCEIIVCLNAVPAAFYVLIYKNDITSPLHYIVGVLSALLGFGRPFFQCCVCVERYLAVVHPVTFLKYRPLRYRVTFSAIAWLIVLGVCSCSPLLPMRIMYCCILLPHYLLMLSVKVFCSVAVLKALKRPGPGEKWSARDAEANCMKKKAFWVIMIILVSIVIMYSPVVIFMFLYDCLSDSQRWHGMSMYSYLLMFSGLVQPLLYLHRAGKLPLIQCF